MSNKELRIKYIMRLAFVLLFFIIICCVCGIFMYFYHMSMEKSYEDSIILEKDFYRNEGMDYRIPLDTSVDSKTDTYVLFSDRLLMRTVITDEELATAINTLNSFFYTVNEYSNINTYYINSPQRIAFEEHYEENDFNQIVQDEIEIQTEHEDYLEDTIEYATVIPVFDALMEESNQYIFNRTYNNWTSIGAYYVAKEFLKSAGMEEVVRSDYYEYAKVKSNGYIFNPDPSFFTDYADVTEDTIYYYLYNGYNPVINILNIHDDYLYVPFVSIARGGLQIFIDGPFQYSSIKGLSENGRRLMIYGSDSAKLISQWMLENFETIVVVNSNYLLNNKNFYDLIDKNNITDLLVVTEYSMLSDESYIEHIEHMTENYTNNY